MKIPVKVKRGALVVCTFTIILVALPFIAFGWDGCVIRNSGEIQGLIFPFGEDGLKLELPGMDPVYVTWAEVQASGKEKSFITPFDQYIYQTKLVDGWGELKKGRIIAYLKLDEGENTPEYLIFKFKKVRLFETFNLDPQVADDVCELGIEPETPANVDLYFQVNKAKLVGLPGIKFNILLRVDGGNADLIVEPVQ